MDCTEPSVISYIKANKYLDDYKAAYCLSQLCQPKTMNFLKKRAGFTLFSKDLPTILSDSYTDSVVKFFQKVRNAEFELNGNASICTFLCAIAKIAFLERKTEYFDNQVKWKRSLNTLFNVAVAEPKEDLGKKEKLKRCLGKLSPENQKIIISVNYEGLDLAEYAQWRKNHPCCC